MAAVNSIHMGATLPEKSSETRRKSVETNPGVHSLSLGNLTPC
jgi:hypothetical protein